MILMVLITRDHDMALEIPLLLLIDWDKMR